MLELRLNPRTLAAIGVALLASLAGLALIEPAARPVVLPALVVANLLFALVVVLESRDGRLPVFELGTVAALITGLYATVPLLGYWLGGLSWSLQSDPRLYHYPPSLGVLTGIAWRYVAYLASFVLAYLSLRGRATFADAGLARIDRPTVVVFLGALLSLSGCFAVFQAVFGDYSFSYARLHEGGAGGPSAALPRAAERIVSWGEGILLVSKLGLLVILLQRWARPRWRLVLLAWIVLETFQVATRLGSRRDMAMVFVAGVLLYDRLVRPLRRWQAATGAAALLVALLVFGFRRDLGGEPVSWAANNEFQVLFANACDLQATKHGVEIPGQLYYSEVLRLIPSRWQPLLPFPVLDPADWYIDVLGLRESGVGLMFGVVSQSIIGGDWVELVLRGAILGLVFAGIHRWYAARRTRFWATLFYLYLCIWSYYTVRATTFHILYFVVYRFLPALVVLATARSVLAGLGRRMPGPGGSRGTEAFRPESSKDHA